MTAHRAPAPAGIDIAAALAERWGRLLLLACVAFVVVVAALDLTRRSTTGLRRQVFDQPELAGRIVSDRIAYAIRLDGAAAGPLPDRMFSIRWTGFWAVRKSATYDLLLGADDAATVRIDGRLVHERNAEVGFGTTPVRIALEAGVHEIEVTYEQRGGGAFLNLLVGRDAVAPVPIAARDLFPTRQNAWRLGTNDRLDQAWAYGLPRVAALVLAVVLLRTIGAWRRGVRDAGGRPGGWPALRASMRQRRASVVVVFAFGVTLLAGALRLDAMAAKYGALDGPPWAAGLQRAATATVDFLLPASWTWPAIHPPYVGGDPINYLKFAREMNGFYQAHVREPVFLATTRLFLNTLTDQDVAVSFASTLFSVLLVTATFFLGVETFGIGAGLVAATALAIERVAIDWGVDGWRDDASAFFVILTAIVLLRLMRRPTTAWAVTFGIVGAAAALTRITSLLLWIPALALFVIVRAREMPIRRRAVIAGLSASVCAVLVAPYLINCARAFGDPLHAINYHTTFYRARERADASTPMSASTYVLSKAQVQPVRLMDTVLHGVTAFPFGNKWDGFDAWSRPLGWALRWAALAGLVVFAFSRQGRVLLTVLVLSIVPFAITWNIPGGGEWRFTLPAYPFYLVAAGTVLTGGALLLSRTRRKPDVLRATPRGLPRSHVVAVTVAVTLLAVALRALPWLAIREDVATLPTVTVVPDSREAVVFGRGWQDEPSGRCLPARTARPAIHLPLPGGTAPVVSLQLTDLQPPGAGDTLIEVTVDGRVRSRVTLRPTDRNQTATFRLEPAAVGWPRTTLELRAATTTAGASALTVPGARFAICAVQIARDAPAAPAP